MAVKVFMIEDSFTMRLIVQDLLNAEPDIVVMDTAKSGEEALHKLNYLQPDCILLDLVMPGMDGTTTLRHIQAKYKIPVVIFSAHPNKISSNIPGGIAHQEIDFVLKPSGEISLDVDRVKFELTSKIRKAVTQWRAKGLPNLPITQHPRLIVIGASTGGSQTIEVILSLLPKYFSPPIVIAQHLPEFFLDTFVNRLVTKWGLTVREIHDHEVIMPGHIYCAPLTRKVYCEEKNNIRRFRLGESSETEQHHNVDAVMQSAATLYKKQAIGVILTGMGCDGLAGMKEIKRQGGTTIVQDRSALVFSMPKEVIDAGVADQVLPMEKIPRAIVEICQS